MSQSKRRGRSDSGMVTVEIALGLIALAAVVYGLIGLFTMVIAQARCVDAAAEIARHLARSDQAAVSRVEQTLPQAASVRSRNAGEFVVVHVEWPLSPWGSWLGRLTITADAETLRER